MFTAVIEHEVSAGISERPPPLARILVVDDEPDVANLVADVLRDAGYAADVQTEPNAALDAFRRNGYELVVADVMMPSLDGINLCLALRRDFDVPLILLSARTDPYSRVIGLRAGADDYVGKPFSGDELVARVERILKRARGHRGEQRLRFGSLVVDGEGMRALRAGAVLPLTATEFKLLRTLARQPGRVFSREELLSTVWEHEPLGDMRVVDVYVGRLRRKLAQAGVDEVRVETARGFGYRLDPVGA